MYSKPSNLTPLLQGFFEEKLPVWAHWDFRHFKGGIVDIWDRNLDEFAFKIIISHLSVVHVLHVCK